MFVPSPRALDGGSFRRFRLSRSGVEKLESEDDDDDDDTLKLASLSSSSLVFDLFRLPKIGESGASLILVVLARRLRQTLSSS